MSDEIKPALTPDEWAKREIERPSGAIVWVGNQEFTNGLALYIADASATHSTEHLHAVAALCLHGQPFGFTPEDVEAINAVLALAAERVWEYDGDRGSEPANSQMDRVADVAAKIAALLPPST